MATTGEFVEHEIADVIKSEPLFDITEREIEKWAWMAFDRLPDGAVSCNAANRCKWSKELGSGEINGIRSRAIDEAYEKYLERTQECRPSDMCVVNGNLEFISYLKAVSIMDKDILLVIHNDNELVTNQQLYEEYCKRHWEKHHEPFVAETW